MSNTPPNLIPTFFCPVCQKKFETGMELGIVMVPHGGCKHCGNSYLDWVNYVQMVKAGRING